MQLTITNKKENKMLDRLEVEGKIVFNGSTPSKLVLTEALATKLEVDMPLIVITKLILLKVKEKINSAQNAGLECSWEIIRIGWYAASADMLSITLNKSFNY